MESRISNESKNVLLAYILLLFGGGPLGLHRFYMKGGFSKTGLAQLTLTIIGVLTIYIFIGFIFLAIVGAWTTIDLFRIPSIIRKDREKLKEEIALDILKKNKRR